MTITQEAVGGGGGGGRGEELNKGKEIREEREKDAIRNGSIRRKDTHKKTGMQKLPNQKDWMKKWTGVEKKSEDRTEEEE